MSLTDPTKSSSPRKPMPDLTWAMLLAHWTSFAQASLALPRTAEGERWKAAVAHIVALQAVTYSMSELDDLKLPGERALALDKGELLVRSHAGTLHALWRGEELPGELATLIHDAGQAVDLARSAGILWTVTAERLISIHPGDLVDRLLELGFEGDCYVPVPGVPVFMSSPAGFAHLPDGSRPDEHILRAMKEFLVDVSRPERCSELMQVYRQFDFAVGRPVRDVVIPASQGVLAGQPLLVCAIEGGEPRPVTLPPRKTAELAPIPVVFEPSSAD